MDRLETCKSCFVREDLALLEVVHVEVVDPMCVFAWTTSFHFILNLLLS